MLEYPTEGLLEIVIVVSKYFSLVRGSPCYKRDSAEISVEFQVLAYFLKIRIPDVLRVFGWISENRDPFKGMWWLPRVDHFRSGCDNFIGIRARLVFKTLVSFFKVQWI